MMLPTLLVVPGVHLKSDIAHSSALSVTPGFWCKSTGFLSEQWTMGICLISSLCSPLQRRISFAVFCMILFIAVMQERQ